MSDEDEREAGASFWARISATAIPSKPHLHETFLTAIGQRQGGRFLDLGCGDGRLTLELAETYLGYEFIGIDVNSDAITVARARGIPEFTKGLSFEVGDIVDIDFASQRFKVVLLQLVISVVGGMNQRRNVLRKIRELLTDDGVLLLSASGVSDDINPEYAQLYRKDRPLTGEIYTYYSRAADGSILYPTHHFTEEELIQLLKDEGFCIAKCTREREASSRRPDQAAWFFYVVAETSHSNKRALVHEDRLGKSANEVLGDCIGASQAPCAKRPRREAITPNSDAYVAAVFAGLSAMAPFAEESKAATSDSQLESSDEEKDNTDDK